MVKPRYFWTLAITVAAITIFWQTTATRHLQAAALPAVVMLQNGTSGADKLYGSEGADEIHGKEGKDYLNGGIGNDYLYGETGDDTLEDSAGENYMDGGDGNDKITVTAPRNKAYGGAGSDTMNAGDGTDDTLLDGGAGSDTITVRGGNRSQINGGDGDDTISFESGSSFVTINGGPGNDKIKTSGIGNDLTINGGDGNDVMNCALAVCTGGPGNDTFNPTKGADETFRIWYGEGNDTIGGGTYSSTDFDKDTLQLVGFTGEKALSAYASNTYLTLKSPNGNTITIKDAFGTSRGLPGENNIQIEFYPANTTFPAKPIKTFTATEFNDLVNAPVKPQLSINPAYPYMIVADFGYKVGDMTGFDKNDIIITGGKFDANTPILQSGDTSFSFKVIPNTPTTTVKVSLKGKLLVGNVIAVNFSSDQLNVPPRSTGTTVK